MKKHDIQDLTSIKLLVDTFYGKVQQDPILGPIFKDKIKDWPSHLEKMYRFWQTVLLEQHTYSGSPFLPHAKMPITAKHFDQWIAIWTETIDLHFEGVKANEAKWRGKTMATLFLSKIEFYNSNQRQPLI